MGFAVRLGRREKFTSTTRGWLLFLFVGLLTVMLAFPIYAAKGGNGKGGGKGGKGVESIVGITCRDTAAYGTLIGLQFAWLLGFAVLFGLRLLRMQRQRVAVARALAHDPTVLIADEPTAAIDPVNAERIMELMVGLVDELGVTLVIASHAHDLMRNAGLHMVNLGVEANAQNSMHVKVSYAA